MLDIRKGVVMRSEILGATVCIISAIIGVKYWELKAASADGAELVAASVTPDSQLPPAYRHGWGEEVRIPVGMHNQFFVTALVNNRAASFLVDTGASYVALRDADARNAGVYTSAADYTHPVRTANGTTNAAFIKLDKIEIDGITVRDVNAFVLPDAQLGMNLLGMSFLSRLESVEARGDELVLKG